MDIDEYLYGAEAEEKITGLICESLTRIPNSYILVNIRLRASDAEDSTLIDTLLQLLKLPPSEQEERRLELCYPRFNSALEKRYLHVRILDPPIFRRFVWALRYSINTFEPTVELHGVYPSDITLLPFIDAPWN